MLVDSVVKPTNKNFTSVDYSTLAVVKLKDYEDSCLHFQGKTTGQSFLISVFLVCIFWHTRVENEGHKSGTMVGYALI